MTYFRPGLFIRKVFNPLAMATGINGAQTVTAIGRTSGQPRAIPAMPVDVAGATYLVSVRGESDWVRNLRANPTVTVSTKGAKRRFQAGEVPVAERAPIIAAYRDAASKSVDPYWQKLPDPIDHPVFRLTPQ
ncbi:MAG: nitroreductase family deazaflavin-dependent oxidoreductase [Lapillicoccus sp.]